jgi:chromosome segregation ATPase
MDDGTWMTFAEASNRLGISTEALRRRADRGRWSRAKGNDGKTRILVPETPVRTMSEARANDIQTMSEARANGAQTMSEHKHAGAAALVSALEGHIVTLKADIERLTAELAGERERAENRADKAMAEHTAQLAQRDEQLNKMTAELAGERDRAGEAEARLREETARADQAMGELAGEKAVRRAGEKLADLRIGKSAARLAERDEQLAAARAAADKATADLVALAQRLAAIAEERAVTEETAPEPPRRSRLASGWAWFLRN